MADFLVKLPENVTGEFYVDRKCIDCDLCRLTAPDNFKRNEQSGFSFVFRQPLTDTERENCDQAKDECPVDAIGSNGNSYE
jgi:ferredoxin